MIHWFNTLFPNFQGPADATDSELVAIKSTIYVWIMHFGPVVMRGEDWTDLKDALTNAASDWKKFLGWVGAAPGYITDGTTASLKPFPTALLNWLNELNGCHQVTEGCADLTVFNLKSTVCAEGATCTVKSRCSLVDSNSNCAVNGSN